MRFSRRRRHTFENRNANSSQVLNLSLFIMLLAFFIVLNALSSFQDMRTQPVMESLEMAFSNDIRRQDIRPSQTPDSQVESIHEGSTLEKLDALFQSQIASFKPVKNTKTGVMHATMSLEEFSNAVMAVGQQDATQNEAEPAPRLYFMPTLVSLLRSEQEGIAYRMDMVFHIRENPADLHNENPLKLKDMIARGSVFAQKLEQAGLPEQLMSVGFTKGDERTVKLFFRPHEPFSPVQKEGTP